MASEMKGKSKYVARQIRETKKAFERVVGTQEERVRGLASRLKSDERSSKKKKANRRKPHSHHDNGMSIFSPEDEYELLCQGVKPWDDDAAVSYFLSTLSRSHRCVSRMCWPC